MTTFPASSSILSADHLNRFLQSVYTLSTASTCQLIKAGVNHTYLITDGAARFVFRIYSLGWRTQAEILEEIRLLGHLQQHALPVSYAIADRQNNCVQVLPAIEGERFGVLFSYAAGEKIIDLSAAMHRTLGTLVGRLHHTTQDVALARTTYTPQALLDNTLLPLEQFLDPQEPEMVFMADAHRYLHAELQKVDVSQLRSGAVHLDIWFDNLNIAENGDITLFDFDFCGNGWLCTDVAYYLLQLYPLETDPAVYRQKMSAFIEGYTTVCTLSDEEVRILPLLGLSLYFFYFGVQCARFDNWSNVFLNGAYLKRYITLRLKKYADFHQMPIGGE